MSVPRPLRRPSFAAAFVVILNASPCAPVRDRIGSGAPSVPAMLVTVTAFAESHRRFDRADRSSERPRSPEALDPASTIAWTPLHTLGYPAANEEPALSRGGPQLRPTRQTEWLDNGDT